MFETIYSAYGFEAPAGETQVFSQFADCPTLPGLAGRDEGRAAPSTL